uniref:Uncharacterized protein n=1 Tax=Nelumbo nucifera TaxID=4432 RepID=A0A822ZNX4_NELNU|nr:TPA_asm: hypothetical protein HUJ06_003435 [Nelumbo nucifera]
MNLCCQDHPTLYPIYYLRFVLQQIIIISPKSPNTVYLEETTTQKNVVIIITLSSAIPVKQMYRK